MKTALLLLGLLQLQGAPEALERGSQLQKLLPAGPLAKGGAVSLARETREAGRQGKNKKKNRKNSNKGWFNDMFAVPPFTGGSCSYFRKKLEDKTLSTCSRAKTRAKMSFYTMDIIFKQHDVESEIHEHIQNKIPIYEKFWMAATVFMSGNTKCDANTNKKLILIKERNNFRPIINELEASCLGSQNIQHIEEKTKCRESQQGTKLCKKCTNKCGRSIKKGYAA
jgi:hypothetical protein